MIKNKNLKKLASITNRKIRFFQLELGNKVGLFSPTNGGFIQTDYCLHGQIKASP